MAKVDTEQVGRPDPAQPGDSTVAEADSALAGAAPITEPAAQATEPDVASQVTRPAPLAAAAKWAKRDARFALAAVAFCLVSLLVFVTAGGAFQGRSTARTTQPSPVASASANPSTATPSGTATPAPRIVPAQERIFDMPSQNAGLMQPAVDAQGNVWFGEMGLNRLARLTPSTGEVREWQPPNAQYNIMATAVDAQGNVWFTEQVANYIGRFNPTTQQFTTFPLEQVNGRSVAPQDLAIDAAGNVWFTEITGGKIGRLDPKTGKITSWRTPAPDGQQAFPYSLALTGAGQVWFGYLSGGAVGTLDPASGTVKVIHLRDAQAQIFSVAADGKGRVWFTELEQGAIGWVDVATEKVTELTVPQALGTNVGLYGVAVAADGSVWFASSGENALVKYSPDSDTFAFYQLGRDNSVPYGVAMDTHGTLWFTADSNPRNYVGAVAVQG